jgi:hypothetical protein
MKGHILHQHDDWLGMEPAVRIAIPHRAKRKHK